MKKEILALNHVCLSENGSEELREVSFSLYEGDILGLISLDNQGLAALLDLIMNNRRLERGSMRFGGSEISGYFEYKGNQHTTALIESKSSLIPALNIADTFFFAKKKGPALIERKKQKQQICRIFEPYGIPITGGEYPDSLSVLDRCRVEIIKAKTFGCKIIILREPSSFLGPKEVLAVQKLVKQIAQDDGTAFLYLCNHHQETLTVCSRLLVMCAGTVTLNKEVSAITEQMMTIVSNDFLKSITRLHRCALQTDNKTVARITDDNGFNLSIAKGECTVLLDLDNKAVPLITESLFSARLSPYHVFIGEKEAFKHRALWSLIPANPVSHSLFFDMSYVDNLTLKNSNIKLPHFWMRRRYAKAVCEEFRSRAGNCVDGETAKEKNAKR